MPALLLQLKNKILGEYPLKQGASLTIGRRDTNDVVLEDPAVSGHHAKIDCLEDRFVLIDLQSKNGSFVNEQLINSHWLKNGDVINIGKHSLVFSYSEDEVLTDAGSDEMEKTMVIDTSQHRNMMKKSKPNAPRALPKRRKKDFVGIIAFLAGGTGKIKLNGKITKLGKHRTSDIVVKGLFVGRTSVTISRRPDGFYLSFVGGLSKPKLNEKIVKQSAILNDLDIIDIGATKLQFFIQKPRPKKKKNI